MRIFAFQKGTSGKAARIFYAACALIVGLVACSSSGAGSSGDDSTSVQAPVFTNADNCGITFVTLSCPTAGATIHYTTDGSDPTDSSATYTESLALFKAATVKAIATKSGLASSGIVTKPFQFDEYTQRVANGRPYIVKNGVSTELPLLPSATGCSTSCMYRTANGDIYVACTTTDASGNAKPCYWFNGTYHAFPLPAGAVTGTMVSGFCIKGNDVYIDGYTRDESKIATPCYWKNGTYVALSVDSPQYGGFVGTGCMFVDDDGSVYISGHVLQAKFSAKPCYWKDGVKTNLSMPSVFFCGATGICKCGSTLYIFGEYQDTYESITLPCVWVDGNFVKLDAPFMDCDVGSGRWGYRSGTVYTSGSDVYYGGYTFQYYMDSRGWMKSPVYWKNGNLVTFTLPGSGNPSGGVWNFQEVDGKVLPCGSFWNDTGYANYYVKDGTLMYYMVNYQD